MDPCTWLKFLSLDVLSSEWLIFAPDDLACEVILWVQWAFALSVETSLTVVLASLSVILLLRSFATLQLKTSLWHCYSVSIYIHLRVTVSPCDNSASEIIEPGLRKFDSCNIYHKMVSYSIIHIRPLISKATSAKNIYSRQKKNGERGFDMSWTIILRGSIH